MRAADNPDNGLNSARPSPSSWVALAIFAAVWAILQAFLPHTPPPPT